MFKFFSKYRKLSREELSEIQELARAYVLKQFEATQVKNNTMVVPRGKEYAEQCQAIAKLFETVKNNRVAQILSSCGYASNTQTQIDLRTGKIKTVR